MPIYKKKTAQFDDDLEVRIKATCDDAVPKDSIRRIYSEFNQGVGMIRPGAKFSGFQSSNGSGFNDDQRYEVSVQFQDIDMIHSRSSGYLTISNLTAEFPELTTFFEAEIIGDKHSFLTRKWGADEDIDRSHWTKFMGFSSEMEEVAFTDPNFKYNFKNERFIFMRWKELFLVPDHHVDNINGASYDGFYYICADLENELIDGFYYHHSSTMFQRLDLRYHKERQFQSYEFR